MKFRLLFTSLQLLWWECPSLKRCTSSQCSQWRLWTELWKHRFPGHVSWECILPGPSRQTFLSLPRSQSLSNNSAQQQYLLHCSLVPPPSPPPSLMSALQLLLYCCNGLCSCSVTQAGKMKHILKNLKKQKTWCLFCQIILNPAHGLYRQWELKSNTTPWTQPLVDFILYKMLLPHKTAISRCHLKTRWSYSLSSQREHHDCQQFFHHLNLLADFFQTFISLSWNSLIKHQRIWDNFLRGAEHGCNTVPNFEDLLDWKAHSKFLPNSVLKIGKKWK